MFSKARIRLLCYTSNEDDKLPWYIGVLQCLVCYQIKFLNRQKEVTARLFHFLGFTYTTIFVYIIHQFHQK